VVLVVVVAGFLATVGLGVVFGAVTLICGIGVPGVVAAGGVVAGGGVAGAGV